MNEKKKKRVHYFELPGHTGNISIGLENSSFSDIEDEEIYTIGKIITNFLYGLLLEKKEVRKSSVNLFRSILKDTSLFIEDKDIPSLLQYSNRSFHNGDYQNSLFLSQLILARINQIIDKKIENDDKLIDKEIIHLQISTLNFIGYLFSKTGRNIDYGIKLTTIANTLLNEFDESNDETISLRAAIHDTLGALYIQKENWEKAIHYLQSAHELDRLLLLHGTVDEIGIRLTCSSLGYALIQKCKYLIKNSEEKLNVHNIKSTIEKAKQYFMMVMVDKPPAVPDNLLKDLELLSAVKRMKQGLALCNTVKKELQKRIL